MTDARQVAPWLGACRASAPIRSQMRRGKYNNKRTGKYASKREAELAANLHALHKAGQIVGLQEQVRYNLVPAQDGRIRNERPLVYIADFVYGDKQGEMHVVDCKGYKTPEYVIKRKLMAYLMDIEVEEM